MSRRSSERAEARRRARLLARGGQLEAEEPIAEPDERRRGGFVSRLFPGAPPLSGRPPPLEGFTYNGVLRPIAERVWLLARMPLVWLLPAMFFFLGLFANRDTTFGFIISFLTFGAPMAAGWFGWRRPALYGAATVFVGYLAANLVAISFFASQGISFGDVATATGLTANLSQFALLLLMGWLIGWYGGYLRRRQAALRTERRVRRR